MRRTQIHKILKSYGQWMQYSVFECELTDTVYQAAIALEQSDRQIRIASASTSLLLL